MPITHLYTLDEIDAEISQAKLDLAAARKALSTQFSSGGSDRRVQRDTVKSLQEHLNWLQQQRSSLQLSADGASPAGGYQSVIGRPAR